MIELRRPTVTSKEAAMLTRIARCFEKDSNTCYNVYPNSISHSDAGLLGSLYVKGLIYDAFADLYDAYETKEEAPKHSTWFINPWYHDEGWTVHYLCHLQYDFANLTIKD